MKRETGHVLIQDLYAHWAKAAYNDDFPASNPLSLWALWGPLRGGGGQTGVNVPLMNECQRVTYQALDGMSDRDQTILFMIYCEPGTLLEKSVRAKTTIKAIAKVRRRAIRVVERHINQWLRDLSTRSKKNNGQSVKNRS